MTTIDDSNYKSSDTSLATYLICKGLELLSIDYSKPRYEYTFQTNTKLLKETAEKHSNDYIIGQALIDPALFTRVNRKLVRIVKNELQWDGQ